MATTSTRSTWFHRHYSCWVMISVCLGSLAIGLPYFSYGALLPYLSSLFYFNTGKITSPAAMSLQPVMLELGITLTGSLSGWLEHYVNIRLLNLVLVMLYVTVVGVSYYIETYVGLTVIMFFIGSLSGQINVCNVARLSEWNPRKSGTANGIMGFFMGISGFLGSFLCTAIINPNDIQEVNIGNDSDVEMMFLDESVIQRTQEIWLAWACIMAALYIPGLFILRAPEKEEEIELFDSAIESLEMGREEGLPLILPQKRGVGYGARDTEAVISPDEVNPADVTTRLTDRTPVLRCVTADPDYTIREALKQPKFYVLSFAILTLSLILLTATEMYKVIALEAINDDRFLNITGAVASVLNAFGMMTWGMILDSIGTRYTFTIAFLVMGPLTISLHYAKECRYGYLANLCVVTFCTGVFTCIAPACQELFGRRDLSLKYAASLCAQGLGCVVFFLMQLGQEFLYGELVFLMMMGIPSMVASLLAYGTFTKCVCSDCELNSR